MVEQRGTGIATPSSRRRVDGVDVDAPIQDERAVNFESTGGRRSGAPGTRSRAKRRVPTRASSTTASSGASPSRPTRPRRGAPSRTATRGGTRRGAVTPYATGTAAVVKVGCPCGSKNVSRPFSPNYRVQTTHRSVSHTGGCGKSKCGKGSTNCSPQKPPVDADDLGYCQKLDRNGAPVAGKTCWADGVDYYDKEECCGTSGNSCNKPHSEWHWCEKPDPIDPCEGFCYVGGKKDGGGYFEGKSYCRRKSSMQSRRRVLEKYRSNLRLAGRRGGLSRVASPRGALDATGSRST